MFSQDIQYMVSLGSRSDQWDFKNCGWTIYLSRFITLVKSFGQILDQKRNMVMYWFNRSILNRLCLKGNIIWPVKRLTWHKFNTVLKDKTGVKELQTRPPAEGSLSGIDLEYWDQWISTIVSFAGSYMPNSWATTVVRTRLFFCPQNPSNRLTNMNVNVA